MPMTFDSESRVDSVAGYYNCDKRRDGETFEAYRKRIARETYHHDRAQAVELWSGKGWDKFNEAEQRMLLFGLPSESD